MIKPTVGRVVLVFRDRGVEEHHQVTDLEAPEPAFVTAVFDDHSINVAGFTAAGTPFSVCPIHLVQEEDDSADEPPRPYAEWMPYQVAAAKKFPVDLSQASPRATEGTRATEGSSTSTTASPPVVDEVVK